MVRDPIQRALSHYQNAYRKHQEDRPWEQIVYDSDLQHKTYIQLSMYYQRILPYLEYFNRSQIYVVILEELKANPRLTLTNTFRFLGVDDQYWSPKFLRPVNISKTKKREPKFAYRLRQIKRTSFFSEANLPNTVHRLYKRWLKHPVPHPKNTGEMHRILTETLASDIAQFREWSGASLEKWSL